MSNKPLQAVLLDMDGTLVDAFPPIIYALNKTLEEFGRPTMTPLEIKRHTGRGEGGMMSLFGDDKETATARFLQLHDEKLAMVEPLPGARELLDWLQSEGLGIAIVTSKGQQRAEAQLEMLGWQSLVPIVIGKIDGRAGKPDPLPVRLACEALGHAPDVSVMVGDGIADIKAAKGAGVVSIGLHGLFSEEELMSAGADQCFETLDEVHQWLKTKVIR